MEKTVQEEFYDNHIIRQRVGKRITELRMQKNLSVRQLSAISGIGASHISKIENGHHAAGLDILNRICQALNAEIIIKERES